MSNGQAMLLALATALLFGAHVARAARWAALFPKKQARTRRGALLVGLGIGYAVNALVPLRVGEIVRGVVASRLNKVRFAEVMATIVAERVADLAVLALIIAAASRHASDPAFANATAAFFAATAGTAFGLACLVRASKGVRGWLWKGASIFNDRIRISVIDFIWATSEILVGGTLLRWKFTVATVGMWSLYAAAYVAFGLSVDAGLMDVVATVLQHPLRSMTIGIDPVGAVGSQSALYIFVLAPVLFILALEPLMRTRSAIRAAHSLRGLVNTGRSSHDARSERFSAPSGYANFLNSLFSGQNRAISGFGMEAIDDCVVHKFYHGGSDALTALVETDQRLIIRKFASGVAAGRLKVQADWIRKHATTELPLVEVIAERHGSGIYSYDMPVVASANDFYDAIHTSTGERNRKLLLRVLHQIDDLHGSTAGGDAPPELIARYLDDKVTRNAGAIAAFAQAYLGDDAYSINGADYHWNEWNVFADRDWLAAQIRRPGTASIHGDLTVENVIVAAEHPWGLYMIDPNPENIFDSPMIDWAKMMQSLHLGYEALNRGTAFSVVGSAISLPDARSQAYAALHETLEGEIRSRFCEDGLREVYFHELVNYLRLATYKIRQSPERGLAFFACTSQLLRRYRARFA